MSVAALWVAMAALSWAGPSPQLTLGPPWRLERRDNTAIVLRLGDTPDGVRIQLSTDETGRVPGVSPIAGGRTLEVVDGGQRWPLVSVGFPERPLSAIKVEVEGPDLVVRLVGPPLRSVTDHPDAPSDPVITWIRLRPRVQDWRIVVDGLAALNLSSSQISVHVGEQQGLRLKGSWGQMVLTSSAASSSCLEAGRWQWSTVPSLADQEPYPRTAITWSP